ncbi:MAG: rhomboid family intramembrane serine protease [Cypionkella sp.]|nr:rhomboid family intramembrane serine protease [Cypionkella sp.]
MFPIRDHNPSGRVPYVTYALIAANVAIFLAYWFSYTSEEALGGFFYSFGLVPADIGQSGVGYAVLTHMFLHGGWMHLAGNMLFLWIFGDNMEDALGPQKYAGFYLISGFCAAAFQYFADPSSNIPMVGASGAIAGVLGGYLLLYPRAKVDVLFIFIIFFRIFSIPAWIVLGVWFGIQLLSSGANDGVAYMAHVGGFIGGAALAGIYLSRRGGRDYWAQNAGAPPHPAADYVLTATRIPRVKRR